MSLEIGKLYSSAGGVYEVTGYSPSQGTMSIRSWNADTLGYERVVSVTSYVVQSLRPVDEQEMLVEYKRVQRHVKYLEEQLYPLREIESRYAEEFEKDA